MKKKSTALIMTVCLVLGLAACTGQKTAATGTAAADTEASDSEASESEEADVNASELSEEDSETSAGESVTAQEEREIDIVLDWYPNAVHEWIYIAMEKGYYAEEGLKVNVQFPSNTNDALSLTAAGKAEIGIYYPHDVIQARINQNIPVRAFGSVCQGPLNIILSLKDKDITSPADMSGKIIGYSGTELSEAMVRSMMTAAGEDPDSVEMIDVGFDLMSSMTTGNVDATIGCMLNHEVPQMEEEGFEVNEFSVCDYGVPYYPELVLVANDDTIENDSEMLGAFMRASQKGFEDMKNDPDAAVQTLLDNQNAENFPLSGTVEKQSTQVLLGNMETDDHPFLSSDTEAWENTIQWMQDEGIIEETCPVDEVVTEINY